MTAYTFDYSRRTGQMRFRDPSGEPLVADRMAGRWEFKGEDPSGKLTVECEVVKRGDTAYVYAPDGSKPTGHTTAPTLDSADNHDSCTLVSQNPFPQGRATSWRVCYARERATTGDPFMWRLRDEVTGELWMVKGYRGTATVSWLDHGSHVFVEGPAFIEEDGIARFA